MRIFLIIFVLWCSAHHGSAVLTPTLLQQNIQRSAAYNQTVHAMIGALLLDYDLYDRTHAKVCSPGFLNATTAGHLQNCQMQHPEYDAFVQCEKEEMGDNWSYLGYLQLVCQDETVFLKGLACGAGVVITDFELTQLSLFGATVPLYLNTKLLEAPQFWWKMNESLRCEAASVGTLTASCDLASCLPDSSSDLSLNILHNLCLLTQRPCLDKYIDEIVNNL